MPDEIAVADTGASAASTEAAAPAATPTETPAQTSPDAQGEQTTPLTFDESLFDGQEAEIPQEQAGQYDALLSISPYIQDEQTLQNAIARQGQVEAVLQGQAPAGALFEPLRTENPQQWTSLMNGIAEYLQGVTGLKLMDPTQAGGQPLTPEQQRIHQLEQREEQRQQQAQQQRQQEIVNKANKQVMDKLPEFTKGRFIEGESPDWIMAQLERRLAGKETQVISAITKGDFTLVQKAIAQISHDERIMFNARGKRIAGQRNALKASVPKTGTKGGADLKLPSEKIDTKNPNWFGDVATRIMQQ